MNALFFKVYLEKNGFFVAAGAAGRSAAPAEEAETSVVRFKATG
jgi:hypothetical protein